MKLEICFLLWVAGPQFGSPYILLERMKTASCIEKGIFLFLAQSIWLKHQQKIELFIVQWIFDRQFYFYWALSGNELLRKKIIRFYISKLYHQSAPICTTHLILSLKKKRKLMSLSTVWNMWTLQKNLKFISRISQSFATFFPKQLHWH